MRKRTDSTKPSAIHVAAVLPVRVLLLCLYLLFGAGTLMAQTSTWQPSAGNSQLPLWPGVPPNAQPVPGPESIEVGSHRIGGKTVTGVSNVTRPTITLYAPQAANTGVAVVVFPGGGFEGLAIDLEGTDVCDWLTSRGIACVLLKYRVPSLPFDWHCHCRPNNLAISTLALEDAQRAMGLVRLHASEWHIDPHKVGVLGFSAGGYLVAEISTIFARRLYARVDAADQESCRPDFAIAVYPGHLWTGNRGYGLNPNIPVTRQTPPTFLVQAEDDHVDGINQALAYYIALKNAGVPAEMHLYAEGGHAFGLRRTPLPITAWPHLVETWLTTMGMTAR